MAKKIEALSDSQKEGVKEMGLGGLLSLKIHSLKRGLCEWILTKFDPDTRTLNVYNESYIFTALDVEWILGLHYGGSELQTNGSPELIEDLQNSIFNGNNELFLHDIGSRLEELKEDSDKFRRLFVLFAVGRFLCPTMKATVNASLLHMLLDVSSLGGGNWAKFVFDSIITGVKHYKAKQQVYVSGCIFVLMVTYLYLVYVG